jgi:starvation-inducible DNA-binding protein
MAHHDRLQDPLGLDRASGHEETREWAQPDTSHEIHQGVNMDINIGIEPAKRKEIAAGLSRVLADSYTLYLKTHNFHWNVTGPMFQTLHLMFETQYNELALAVDLIAERIRSLGVAAPGTYRQFIELATIKEDDGVPKAESMIRLLVEGHETVARTARTVFKIAEAANDQPTCDLLTQRLQVHEKTAWMLRSLLD